jgi:dihydrolipoamide dehydrogenase
VTIENEKGTSTEIYNKVLVSVGRKPNTNLLNIESTGVEVDERGFINVDVYQRTTIKNIFAIGDIVGNPMLAHKATHEGKVAAEVASGLPAAFDVRAIPSVVFTDPEVAWAGLTEIEAKEKGINYKKGEFPWAASGKAIAMGANQGKTKILFDPETSQVLGVGIVGPGAGDMISEGMLAIEMGADAEDIGLTIHPHPTLGETFGLAAEVFEGTITDLYVPKK